MNEQKKLKKATEFVQAHFSVFAVLILVVIGIALYGSNFLLRTNLVNTLHMASMLGIMGLGVNLCFLIGCRDLSVGAVGALASMASAWFSHYGFIPAVVSGLLVGFLIGLSNGLIITKLKIQPFIATLATQLIARGIAMLLNDGNSFATNFELEALNFIGDASFFNTIPVSTVIFVILIGLMTQLCEYSRFGRSIYAVGGNEESAFMMGVNVDKVKIVVFTLSGLLASMSGIILSGRLRAGQPSACNGWEMTIMAAVVIGGTRVNGGIGKVSGIFCGALFLQLITNLINLNGHINTYWKNVITAAILLIVVLIQTIGDSRKASPSEKTIPQETRALSAKLH